MNDISSIEELRKKNIGEAKDIFEYFVESVKAFHSEKLMSWEPQKDREKRTRFVLATIAFWRLARGEYVFFDKRYLESVVDLWKEWKNLTEKKYHKEISKWIQMYEERIKHKNELGEVGERFVDLASSYYEVPICFSSILEYEALPNWGAIISDFRKLLGVLAPVKVGIFYLPKLFSTSKLWVQDVDTGKIKWEDKVLDSNKPDQLIEDIKKELKTNELEHPYTVYLIVLIHSQTENDVNLYGYLLWRTPIGEVSSEKLELHKLESIK